jgi:hypothetical protein
MRRLRQSITSLVFVSLVALAAGTSRGQGGDVPAESVGGASQPLVDYLREVRPILRAKCATCHNESEAGGGLRLDSAAVVMKGGDSGPAIVPGNSQASRLLQAVLQTGDLKMPPPEEAKPLDETQIGILRRWIDQGAVLSEGESSASHWSFQKPVRPAVPAHLPNDGSEDESSPSSASPGNPIDALLARRHRELDLHALPAAPPHVQLRRVYLDLIGLPPTPEQMQAFLDDDSADAWEKVVDELLASPHYGERWGRHWMDVWRYSDWDGYAEEVRESKPHIWRWRDWIIESLNKDMPYDRMIMEMLAADEIAPQDPGAIRATGFLVRNWYVFNRNTWIDNTIEHTGKAFLGLTFNCARCHDHMYDPISQVEYYQLRAFFEPHDVRTDRLPGQTDVTKDGLVRVFDAQADARTLLFVRGDEKNPLEDRPLEPRVPASLMQAGVTIQPVELPPVAYYPGLQDFMAADALRIAEADAQAAAAAHLAARDTVEKIQADLLALQQASTKIEAPAPFLADDFKTARPDVWSAGTGNWQHQDGRLLQLDPADAMCRFGTRQSHPADFTAKLRFRITGGDVYQSVGIAWDASDDQNYSFVYASHGGSKLQVAHRVQGVDQYPPAGMKELPIELQREHELLVTVRGTQCEVTFDGAPVITYTLPHPRPAEGQFHLWSYDATAEFLSLEISRDPVLSESSLRASLQQGEAAALLAEKKHRVATAAWDFAKARIAADQANYSQPPAANAKELSLAAGQAERNHALLQAELDLLAAERILQDVQAALPAEGSPVEEGRRKAVSDAEAAVTTANAAVDSARKAAQEPFEAYTRLTPVYPSTSTGRRSALARWIASRDNPLTARVAVNHIWLRHFHQPLVPTVFDFGSNGKPSPHPDLLDWLACELMDNGWKMKPLHRLIVTSDAYRRASSPSADQREDAAKNAAADPDNRQWWRQNSHRMEAEVVRDATLQVAGKLDATMFGQDLDPNAGLTLARRSIYFRNSKEKKMTFLATFDSPNPVECYQRSESISPQQSLAMSNSPLTRMHSRHVAAFLSEQVKESPPEDASRLFVTRAFQRVLNREPQAGEVSECLAFLRQQADQFASARLTAFPGVAETAVQPSADAEQRARENLVHVLFNHNDFVTVR